MLETPQRIPQPLEAEEIKEGIAERVKQEVLASLNRTCSLNRRSFSTLKAKWWIEFELDDFGRIENGAIGGNIGEVGANAVRIEGEVAPMPPDRFRRETKQPIPKAVVMKKREDDGLGVSKSFKQGRKVKDA